MSFTIKVTQCQKTLRFLARPVYELADDLCCLNSVIISKVTIYEFDWLCQVGDLVYGRLLVANKDMEPELVCIDSNSRSSGYGVLRGGFMIHTSTSLARKYVIVYIVIRELLDK